MHLRRALLLFAIVLGLAALVASVSRPREQPARAPAPRSTAPQRAPTATPREAPPKAVRLTFTDERRVRRRLRVRQPASVSVKVGTAGQVEIPALGLSASAEPLTPARFELLPSEAGRYEVRFTPAEGGRTRVVGELVVRPT